MSFVYIGSYYFILLLALFLTTESFLCGYRFHFVGLKWHNKVTNLPLLWLFSLHHQSRTESFYMFSTDISMQVRFFVVK